MSIPKEIIREKESFRWEVMLDIDGHETRVYIKGSVNYERQTFKVTPVITMVHGWDEEVQDQFLSGIEDCRTECERRLSQYRGETGAARQPELDFAGAASN